MKQELDEPDSVSFLSDPSCCAPHFHILSCISLLIHFSSPCSGVVPWNLPLQWMGVMRKTQGTKRRTRCNKQHWRWHFVFLAPLIGLKLHEKSIYWRSNNKEKCVSVEWDSTQAKKISRFFVVLFDILQNKREIKKNCITLKTGNRNFFSECNVNVNMNYQPVVRTK